MFLTMVPTFFLYLLLASIVKVADSQAIGTYYAEDGPTIITQDPSSGKLFYTLLSGNGYLPFQEIPMTDVPKKGTPISITGYDPGIDGVWIQIFYQNIATVISQVIIQCAYLTGNCTNVGQYTASFNVTTAVNDNTGLSVALMSTDIGYRIFYEDVNGVVRQISYANNTEGVVTNWGYGTVVTNYTATNVTGMSLASAWTIGSNTTVNQTLYQFVNDTIQPFQTVIDDSGATTLDSEVWIPSPPIDKSMLPNWNPSNASIATVIDGNSTCIFYIDMAKQLQFLRSDDNGQTWALQPRQPSSSWPLADYPNAPLTASISPNETYNTASIFYQSNGTIVESKTSNFSDTWSPAVTVAPLVFPIISNHKAIKIGAGVGSVVAFLLLSGIVWLRFIRKRQRDSTIPKDDSIYEFKRDEKEQPGIVIKAELDGEGKTITELDHDPDCQLLHQLAKYRQYEVEGEIPIELQNSETIKSELEGLCKCELDASVRYELESPSFEKNEVHILSKTISGTSTTLSGGSDRKEKGKAMTATANEIPAWAWQILMSEKGKRERGVERVDKGGNDKKGEIKQGGKLDEGGNGKASETREGVVSPITNKNREEEEHEMENDVVSPVGED